MKILTASEFATRRLAAVSQALTDEDEWFNEKSDNEGVFSEIRVKGMARHVVIKGAILEVAIVTEDNHYLVIMNHDCPYEESLSIYYFDSFLTQLDHGHILWPYASGDFQQLVLLPPDRIQFNFFADIRYQLTLYQDKRYCLPWVYQADAVWRPFRCYRYFDIACEH